MKIKLLFTLFALTVFNSFSQDVSIKDDIAFIDNQEYVKIIKKNKRTYLIKNIKTDKEIIIIKNFETFNSIKNENMILPQVTFVDLNKTWGFETSSLTNEIEVIKFIYKLKIVFLNGDVNREMALHYYSYFNTINKS